MGRRSILFTPPLPFPTLPYPTLPYPTVPYPTPPILVREREGDTLITLSTVKLIGHVTVGAVRASDPTPNPQNLNPQPQTPNHEPSVTNTKIKRWTQETLLDALAKSSHTFKSFCRSQLPHNSVNLSLTMTIMRNKLTNLCGN